MQASMVWGTVSVASVLPAVLMLSAVAARRPHVWPRPWAMLAGLLGGSLLLGGLALWAGPAISPVVLTAAASGAGLGLLVGVRFLGVADRLRRRCAACSYDVPLSSQAPGGGCPECGHGEIDVFGYLSPRAWGGWARTVLLTAQTACALAAVGGFGWTVVLLALEPVRLVP